MQLQNIDYLKQFRQEDVILPFEQGQSGKVHFRHFSRSRKDRLLVQKHVERQITNSRPVSALLTKIETEDLPISRRLTSLLKKLTRSFSTQNCRRFSPPQFIARLLAETGCFLKIAAEYQERTQFPLLNTLRHIAEGSKRATRVGSADIRNLQTGLEQYLDELYTFHDSFAALLVQEYGRTGKSAVTSPAEEALLKLTTLIKSQVFSMEATIKYLVDWKKATRKIEAQSIYN